MRGEGRRVVEELSLFAVCVCVGGEGPGNAMECKASVSFINNKEEASSVNPDFDSLVLLWH